MITLEEGLRRSERARARLKRQLDAERTERKLLERQLLTEKETIVTLRRELREIRSHRMTEAEIFRGHGVSVSAR